MREKYNFTFPTKHEVSPHNCLPPNGVCKKSYATRQVVTLPHCDSRDCLHRPTDYRHTDKHLKLVMTQTVRPWARKQMDGRTDGQTLPSALSPSLHGWWQLSLRSVNTKRPPDITVVGQTVQAIEHKRTDKRTDTTSALSPCFAKASRSIKIICDFRK